MTNLKENKKQNNTIIENIFSSTKLTTKKLQQMISIEMLMNMKEQQLR